MPPGPKRRKAVKKKNKNKPNKNSVSSSTPHYRHGESEVRSQASKAERKSPLPKVKAEKKESNISIETNEKAAKDNQGKIESDKGTSSQNLHEKIPNSRSSSLDNKSPGKKKSAVIEPATVAEYLAQPFESSSLEKENLSVNSIKSMNTKVQEKDNLVVAEMPFEDTVNNCSTSTSEVIGSLPKYNEVQKTSPKSKDNCLIPDSENVKCPYCGKRNDDRVNEPVSPEFSERQPLLVSSPPRAAEKSSWKSCCGIFVLFSGSSK